MTRTTTRRPKMTAEELQEYNTQCRTALESVMSATYAVLHTAPVWSAALAVAAALPARGPVNVIAITGQLPTASDVRGAGTWRKNGRHPAKGSTSLRIWAPIKKKPSASTDSGQNETESAPATETPSAPAVRTKVRTYKAAPVFDISQTEGDELDPAPAAAIDAPAMAQRLAAALPAAPEPLSSDPEQAVRDLLTQHARARLAGPEMVTGQHTAEAGSAAHLAALMTGITPSPAAAPQLGGIVTGEKFTPAIKEAAVRVIDLGRELAALATGTPPAAVGD